MGIKLLAVAACLLLLAACDRTVDQSHPHAVEVPLSCGGKGATFNAASHLIVGADPGWVDGCLAEPHYMDGRWREWYFGFTDRAGNEWEVYELRSGYAFFGPTHVVPGE